MNTYTVQKITAYQQITIKGMTYGIIPGEFAVTRNGSIVISNGRPEVYRLRETAAKEAAYLNNK